MENPAKTPHSQDARNAIDAVLAGKEVAVPPNTLHKFLVNDKCQVHVVFTPGTIGFEKMLLLMTALTFALLLPQNARAFPVDFGPGSASSAAAKVDSCCGSGPICATEGAFCWSAASRLAAFDWGFGLLLMFS